MPKAKEKKIALIYPHQLFEDHPALSVTNDVYLVEDGRFFTDFKFHKKKLLFHRESMLSYQKELVSRGHKITHIKQGTTDTKSYLTELMLKNTLKEIYATDPCDQKLMRHLQRMCRRHQKRLYILESPAFLTLNKVLEDFFNTRKNFSMASFYIQQRKRLEILVRSGKPVGGKWSFDPENRKKLPHSLYIPEPKTPETTPSKHLASEINKEYEGNPGIVDEFIFPVTRRDARRLLRDLIENRLKCFGDYEDSISAHSVFVFHSVLSPLLNISLLTPKEVLEEVLLAAEHKKIPINSLEGFVRQIIGWREFI